MIPNKPTRPTRGRPAIYPWRDIEIGEEFTAPVPSAGGPTLNSLRNMACQVHRKHPTLRFRVNPVPVRNRWIVTRIATA